MPSLIGLNFANKLIDEVLATRNAINTTSITGKGRYKNITVSCRHCYRVAYGKQHYTGGLVIKAKINSSKIYGGGSKSSTFNLRPDWTADSFKRAVQRATDWLLAEHHRLGYLENLYDKVTDKLSSSKGFIRAVERREKKTGHSVMYEDMTVEQAEGWSAWIDEWIAKH